MKIYIDSNSNENLETFLKYNTNIEIIKFPELYFKENKVICNFDAILYLDGGSPYNRSEIVYQAILAGIPEFGIKRFTKNEQTILLLKNNINIPKTWFCEKINSTTVVSLLNNINNNKKIVIKYNVGARGLGQLLLTKRELIDLLECNSDEINELFKDCKTDEYNTFDSSTAILEPTPEIISKNTVSIMHNVDIQPTIIKKYRQLDKLKNIKFNYDSCIKDFVRYGDKFIIQEYIGNRKEWRMLWFYNQDPIIIERNIDDGNWQSNACNNSAGSSKVLSDSKMFIEYLNIDNDFYDKICNLCNGLNAPFMSIDIYQDNIGGKFGIFEFQSEFGWTNTDGIDTQVLYNKINNSIIYLINKQIQLKKV